MNDRASGTLSCAWFHSLVWPGFFVNDQYCVIYFECLFPFAGRLGSVAYTPHIHIFPTKAQQADNELKLMISVIKWKVFESFSSAKSISWMNFVVCLPIAHSVTIYTFPAGEMTDSQIDSNINLYEAHNSAVKLLHLCSVIVQCTNDGLPKNCVPFRNECAQVNISRWIFINLFLSRHYLCSISANSSTISLSILLIY